MPVLTTAAPVFALVLGRSARTAEVLHVTDVNDVFAPVCGAYYTSAQTVGIVSGLHAAPISRA